MSNPSMGLAQLSWSAYGREVQCPSGIVLLQGKVDLVLSELALPQGMLLALAGFHHAGRLGNQTVPVLGHGHAARRGKEKRDLICLNDAGARL